MPFKHQTESYRIIKGVRYESYGDFPHAEARKIVSDLRKTTKAVAQSIGGGMYRVFVVPPISTKQAET